jgi:uncharacterized repeat protein (TIGR02543 family)
MATYLIQNGVNKRGDSVYWSDLNSTRSPDVTWTGTKLSVGVYAGANSYATGITGWSHPINATGYAHLYITGYFSTFDDDKAWFGIGKYGDNYSTATKQNGTTSSKTYKFDLTGLASATLSSLQTFLYFQRYWRSGGTSYGYITQMYLTKDYTITYHANGGSGAPDAQTKEEGSRTLSTTTPTKSGYAFLGWATSASATSATYQPGSTIDLTADVNLYAVWKAQVSTVSATNAYINDNDHKSTITINQQGDVNKYSHILKYSVVGNRSTASGTIANISKTSTNPISQSWKPPESILMSVTNSRTCTCAITCETYDGSTLLGSKVTSVTLTVPNTYAPTVSGDVSPTNLPSGLTGKYVSGKSCAAFSNSVTTQFGASPVTWRYTVNGTTTNINDTSTSKTYTSGAVTGSTLKVSVTDSRGLTGEKSYTIDVLSYTAPQITNVTLTRADSTGTISTQGQRLKAFADVVVSPLDGYNTIRWFVDYRPESESTWRPDKDGTLNDYTSYIDSLSDDDVINESVSYVARIRVTDAYGTSNVSLTVSTALSIMDFKANGLGVAFGKVHEAADKTVEIASDWSLIKEGNYINAVVDGDTQDFNASTAAAYISAVQAYALANCASKKIFGFHAGWHGIGFGTAFCVNGFGATNLLLVLYNQNPQVGLRTYYYVNGAWTETYGHGDTGWYEPALSSEFAQYRADDFYKVRFRRIGNVVHLAGTIKPTAEIAGDNNLHDIFTLPVGFRPASTIDIICQGSGTSVWLLQVHYSGVVSFSRYRNENGYQAAGTSVWLPFSATFIPA